MTEFQKIAESEHKVIIGITIMLVIILVMEVISITSIAKTMKVKDQTIEEIKNKKERRIKDERI